MLLKLHKRKTSLQERRARTQAWPSVLAFMLYIANFLVCLLSFGSVILFRNAGAEGVQASLLRFFDVNSEGNLPSWYSSTQLLLLGILLAIFAWHNFKKNLIASWLLCFLAGLFLFLSLDEASEIHERIGGLTDFLLPNADRSSTAFGVTGIWTFVIGIPTFLFLAVLFLKLKPYFHKTPTVLWKYFIGLTLFMLGAIGIETATNFIADKGYIFAAGVLHFEELFEMMGITTMVWATASLLYSYHLRITLDPVEALSTKSELSAESDAALR